MNPELAYFLKINAGIALFFAFYRMFLYKDTFFNWRRTLLLCFLGVSVLYPLLNIQEWVKEQQPMTVIADFYAAVMLPEVTSSPNPAPAPGWSEVVFIGIKLVYWLGVVALSVRFLIQLSCVVRIRLQSREVSVQGVTVYIPKKASEPFSFFHWIFLQPDLYSREELDEIITHELTHAEQRHSLDVIFSELLCIACWINPFIWLLKQEIRNNLEYLADNHVLQSGHDYKSYQYHLLGLAHQKRAIAPLSNSFNVLPLKRRIKMMNKKRTKEISKTKYLIFLPLAALLLIVSNIETVARTTRNIAKETLQIVEEKIAPAEEPQADAQKPETVQEEVVREESPAPQEVPVPTEQPAEPAHTATPAETNEAVYEIVEQMPSFPGGMPALMKYLNTNVRYPVEAQEAGQKGRVIVQFIVEKDGSINNLHVVVGQSPSLDAEALRVLGSMPDWQPGTANGEPVRVKYTVPVVFNLMGSSKETQQTPISVKEVSSDTETVFEVVENMPTYPGGMAALQQFLSHNIKYPVNAMKAGTEGRVIVQFIVDKEGTIRNPLVARSVSSELDAEALRVIGTMPKWKPGSQRGVPVDVRYTVPIVFRLTDENSHARS